jgi:DNA glycosylase AlkZ-like
MPETLLTLRELNRATLARQLLLERSALQPAEAIAQVAGLQAQKREMPYVGLWSRLRGFRREQLHELAERGDVVRASLMRFTLQLFTAADYAELRADLQPALTRSLRAFVAKRIEGLDQEPVLATARAALSERPLTFAELRELLAERFPDWDTPALALLVRSELPLVQVAGDPVWGWPATPAYELAEERVAAARGPHELVRRYLAAFGPAKVADVQAWSGLAGLRATVKELVPELVSYRDEQGKELVDLPGAPLPDAAAPAPPLFLPELDNAILAHADRSRMIADEHRSHVFLSAGRVRATFLLDGFVAGTWKLEDRSTLVVEPFSRLSKADRTALGVEAEGLLRFMAGAAAAGVRFA